MDSSIFAALPIWYAAFLLSVTCHEAAHSWAALVGGDTTAYRGGQVTLDPRPHMQREPIGLIAMPLVTFFLNGGKFMFGWASAPYNPAWADRYPRRAFAMSLAGPFTNIAIVLVSMIALKLMVVAGLPGWRAYGDLPFIFEGGGFWSLLAGFLYLLAYLNTLLAIFNLIPVPPLDGFSVFGVLLSREQYLRLSYYGRQYWIVGLLIASAILPFFFHPVMDAVHRFAVSDVPPPPSTLP